MKKFLTSKIAIAMYALVFAAAIGLYAMPKHPSSTLVNVGETAQDWNLKSPSGESVAFYEAADSRPSVLIFWATWCGYCQELMPELAEVQTTLPSGTANFYALNVFEDGDPIAYFDKHGYEFELVLEADEIAEKYGVIATPGIIVVGSDNAVIYSRWGNGAPGEIASQLKEVLLAQSS